MKFIANDMAGLFTISLKKLEDERGAFSRTFCKKIFQEIGFNKEFVQTNQSQNTHKGTLRGLHFQQPPFSETKLIRCMQGSVYDVAVDLRKNSPTFLQYFGIILSAENMMQILIPNGFAHGFQTLEDNTTLLYQHTEYYTKNADAGLMYNDPAINIKWPLPPVKISDKDKSYTLLNNKFKGLEI